MVCRPFKNMEIQYYKSNDLIMAEYNPRQLTKDQYSQLKDSIKRFGLVDPLIVNKNKERKNILVGGHQRFKIAKEMGIDEIPCVEVDLTLDAEKELNIRLNKNVGEWDYDALANYFDVGELTDWGFSNDELQFYEDEPVQGLIDDDEIPEVEEAITKEGDLWILGEHRVLCGDSTKKEDVDLLMDSKKADMVFTDPPYGLGGYGGRKKMALKGDDQDVTPFYSCIPDANEVYVWGRIYNLVDINFHPRDIIVWKKNNFGLGKGYRGQYEVCFYKGEFSGSDSDVWEINKDTNYKHPTQKPTALCERAIKNSNPKIIMDLFLGSGSTLIAAEKTNRKCYGMELDPNYCDVIVKRWEEFTGKKAERIERVEG
jgi:DNA modification methylase